MTGQLAARATLPFGDAKTFGCCYTHERRVPWLGGYKVGTSPRTYPVGNLRPCFRRRRIVPLR